MRMFDSLYPSFFVSKSNRMYWDMIPSFLPFLVNCIQEPEFSLVSLFNHYYLSFESELLHSLPLGYWNLCVLLVRANGCSPGLLPQETIVGVQRSRHGEHCVHGDGGNRQRPPEGSFHDVLKGRENKNCLKKPNAVGLHRRDCMLLERTTVPRTAHKGKSVVLPY